MLTFIRRIIYSRFGVIGAFILLGLMALSFAAGDVSNLSLPGTGGLGSGTVAEVGGDDVTSADLRQLAQGEVEAQRRQQPTFDIAQYLGAGGLEGVLERLVTGRALAAFADEHGVVVSKRSVDGELASIPALLGPTGQFDQAQYENLLAQRRLTDAQVRADIARDIVAQRLTAPQVGASQVAQQLALPYASLLLERRFGQIGFIPYSAVPAGPAPTAPELQAFYGRNVARYTVPERRVVRYAIVTPEQVAARAQPTNAELAQAYAAQRARFAPSERRTVTQVVVAARNAADAIAAKVRGGQSVADAARAAGLEPTTRTAVARDAYASLAGPAVAEAVFAAAEGAVVGPVRGSLGFVVARVDDVAQVAGKTLAEARPELVAELTREKTARALADTQGSIDDALTDNATFDEVVTERRLQAQTTRPLLASGVDPENPAAQPDPRLGPVLQAAFGAEQGDTPQMVPLGPDGSFAVVAVGQVAPAAPRPLAAIRDQVARDFLADRARQAARRVANQVVARSGRGGDLRQALARTGLNVPAPRPLNVLRSQIAANPRGVEPALVLLFSLAPGTAKLLESPGRDGWLVIRLDRVQPGDARGNARLINATRADIGGVIGREYAEQFARATRKAVGVEINRDAVAAVRRELSGQAQ